MKKSATACDCAFSRLAWAKRRASEPARVSVFNDRELPNDELIPPPELEMVKTAPERTIIRMAMAKRISKVKIRLAKIYLV